MSWTTPIVWVTGQLVTAAQLNTHISGNMLETAVAKVTTQGDIPYATGANALTRLAKGTAYQKLGMNAGATAPEWQNGGMELISSQGPLTGTSSASFSSIPGTFKNLRLLGLIRGTTINSVLLTFNGDATNSYNYETFTVDDNTPFGAKSIAAPGIVVATIRTTTASNSVTFDVNIPGYLNTSLYKSLTSISSASGSGASKHFMDTYSGMWLNLAAITSIQITLAGGLFDNCDIVLYGMR